MDLKALQRTVDNLDQLVLKLEGMGFDPTIFDDLAEAAESIKQAGKDAREFKKTMFFATFVASSVAFSVAAYFAISYAVTAKITKIDRNKIALELLDKADGNIRINPVNDPKTGLSALAISADNRLVMSQDAKTVFIVLKPQ